MILDSFTILTGEGFWNPLIFLIGFLIMFLISYVIYSFGNKDYSFGTSQTLPFLSGNASADERRRDFSVRIDTTNLYWGFSRTLADYYKRLFTFHTGSVNDYFTMFVITIAVLLVVIMFVGTKGGII